MLSFTWKNMLTRDLFAVANVIFSVSIVMIINSVVSRYGTILSVGTVDNLQ